MEVQIQKITEEERIEVEKEVEQNKEKYSAASINIKESYIILWEKQKVGLCSFSPLYESTVEVRYALFLPYRNKKLSIPIWKEVRKIYGKMYPNIQKIYCLVSPNNIRSLKIVRKDMTFDYEFYDKIQEEGCNIYYPYFFNNPYYKEEKQLTYTKIDAKIKI